MSEPGSQAQPIRGAATYPRGAVLLWAAAAALALLFVPLFALYDALQGELAREQVALIEAQVLRVAPVTDEELASLRAAAAQTSATEELVQSTLARMTDGGVPWLAVLQRVMPVPLAEVRLTGLAQERDRLLIYGIAASEPGLAAYAASLASSPLFEAVQIESATEGFIISLRLRGYEP
ncbi:MAG: PilN domain-containing protein [Anaerolineae bacterium]|nr:PilN domain-containing protein [Anaerolineae bacterium]